MTEKERLRAHYLAYRERIIARSKAWAAKNRERSRAIKTAWRLRHPEKQKAARRAWEKTPAGKAAHRRWYLANKKKAHAINARWIKAHPKINAARCSKRYALRRGAASADFTAHEWAAMKAMAGGRCHYCGEERPLTQDHVIPVSRGGRHTASNIVAACRSCNSRKKDKLP
jgi:5-methylcytosine-specific restriction endonuclease McrA